MSPKGEKQCKAELVAILERRPDLKGKSLEAAKRIMWRDARLSLKPLRYQRLAEQTETKSTGNAEDS